VILETERLIIRSVVREDAVHLQRLFSDPAVLRYLPPSPPATLETAKRSVERRMTVERERGYGAWMVELKSSSEFIGDVGLLLVEGTGPEIELAYHYLPSAWGKGYGTEAARAVLRHGFETCALEEIIAICIPENIGSWRIMEKAGMQYVGTASYYGLVGLKKYVANRATWGR